jgi:type I restriction enzyme S subunit
VGAVEGKYLDDSEEKITKEGYESCSTTLLPENSVIYSSRASIGHIAINEVPVCTNQGFKSFVTEDAVDPEYLYYCLQWKTPEIEHIAEGSTYTEISKRDMVKVEIPLPPLDVQRRIVTVLDRTDALRTKRQQAIGRFDDLLQATFFDLFGDPVANPKGWETVKFGDLLTTSLWNGLSPSTDGTHPGQVLILSAITDSVFHPEEVKEAMFDRPLSEAQERIVDTDTFLICRGNGNLSMVGTGVFPTEDMPDTLFPDTIIGARPDQDRIHPAYLETLWFTQYVRGQLEKVARTTNGTHKINQKKTRNIELRLPPMEVQKQFASIHDRIQKNKQRYASDRFDDLFDALLHRAFRGDLELNDAAFETATDSSPSEENGRPDKAAVAQGNLFSETT